MSLFIVSAASVSGQGTAFTYQGRLNAGGTSATGLYDLRFALYDAANPPANLLAGPLTNAATSVSNGLFTVTLDFGPGVFTGAARWLQVDVRTNGAGSFTPLDPRQALTPAPYAIAAATLSGPVPASQLSGVVPLVQLPSAVLTNYATSAALAGFFNGSFGGSFYGNGSGLSALNPANLTAGTAPISISGNAATASVAGSATNLLGPVADAQIPANFARLNGTNTFSGSNAFAGVTLATNGNNLLAGTFLGNGGGLTNLNTAQFANSVLTNGQSGVTLGGTFNGNAATATTAANFSGLLSGDVTGPQTATVVASVGGQSAANVASGASLANAATSANTAGAIVRRDASGNFTNSSQALTGNLFLPTTTASAGIIYCGGSPLIHSYGSENFFAGTNAGNLSLTGTHNTAVGSGALHKDTNGDYNTALGAEALANDSSGMDNVACGQAALSGNSSGSVNVACGVSALAFNTSGWHNTALGGWSLYDNISGSYNIAVGDSGLSGNTSGSNNIALGYEALGNDKSGSYNIALGDNAGFNITGNNNIDIGNQGSSSDSGIIRLGTPGTHTAIYLAGALQATANFFMNDKDLQFRGDTLHGLGWYGAGKLFANANVNGPVLYGNGGGGLGTIGSTTNLALCWTAAGNVGIGTASPAYPLSLSGGAYCTGSQWQNACDRNLKEHFHPADSRAVLEKLAALPISTWNYKTEAPSIEHLGPTAQDFQAAFALGDNERSIGTVDEGGVALAAIQGLNEKVEQQNAALRAENAELKARLERLERLLNARGAGGQ